MLMSTTVVHEPTVTRPLPTPDRTPADGTVLGQTRQTFGRPTRRAAVIRFAAPPLPAAQSGKPTASIRAGQSGGLFRPSD